ncbi:hypothetical protein GQ53DRAFT_798996 [Thozetella sp. PMI_491]|nr:hypothetical protein GQ53DRAFT_798996 [Thozetella sp. PMI_491]
MASTKQRARRKRDRTFTGCWRCRSRKVKCDEQRPHCRACQRLGKLCDGYGAKFVWVEDEHQPYRSDGRRYVECAATWGELPVLDSNLVDQLILDCDPDAPDIFNSRSVQSSLAFNPFSVFQALGCLVKTPPLLSDACKLLAVDPTDPARHSREARFLFHHYTGHVSMIMIPYFHPRNPWSSSYPAAARRYQTPEQKALYNAMLAHAAYNLSSLGSSPEMMAVAATKYYTIAIEQLKDSLLNEKRDYGTTLAAVMTLLMAEVYNGRPGTWKQHLNGAWSLLRECSAEEPWNTSDFACCSTQSLYIIKILNETCQLREPVSCIFDSSPKNRFLDRYCPEQVGAGGRGSEFSDEAMVEAFLACSISSTHDFGFTLGCTESLLACISTITSVSERMQSQAMCCEEQADLTDEVVSEVLSLLDMSQAESSIEDSGSIDQEIEHEHPGKGQTSVLVKYQREAFISATYIYLYRVLFDLPPSMLRQNVSEVLTRISHFYSVPNGNLSIWPAFIAAVEAYTVENKFLAREWLNHTTTFGIGSRHSVRKVVEEVWERREAAARDTGVDEGLISVDWREVMSDLGLSILLV